MSTALASLWQIEETLLALLDSIATCPEELKPELQADVERYLGQEAAKVDHVAHVLAALDYEQKAASDEIARLQERKKAAKASQDRLEAYVCRVISARGGGKLNGNTNALSVRASDSVVITDEASVPETFVTVEVITSRRIDKVAIKKALKAGLDVPGVDLEYRSNLTRR